MDIHFCRFSELNQNYNTFYDVNSEIFFLLLNLEVDLTFSSFYASMRFILTGTISPKTN